MRLYVSFEDKVIDEEYAGYRRQVFDFLKSHELVVREGLVVDEEIFGQTKIEEDQRKTREGVDGEGSRAESITICHRENGAPSSLWKLDYSIIRDRGERRANIQQDGASSYLTKKEQGIPVFVIDSDGLDPEGLLDYIEQRLLGGVGRCFDHLRAGHVSSMLSMLGANLDPPWVGKFGIVVQHPNLEGGEFGGFSPELADPVRMRGLSDFVKIGLIAELTKKTRGLNNELKVARLDKELVDENGIRIQLLSEMVSQDEMHRTDPQVLVETLLDLRSAGMGLSDRPDGKRSLLCSGYLAKRSPYHLGGKWIGEWGSRGVEMNGAASIRFDGFSFRMFDTS
ncbi:MAG: hypothetical protein CMI21_12950 [Opitutae bacterium]|nr:hypothetical protein [Opitutae bacterium]